MQRKEYLRIIISRLPCLFRIQLLQDVQTPVLYSIAGNVNVPFTPNTTATITDWFNTGAYGNSVLTNNTDVGLGAPYNYSSPDFNPGAGSAAATGASFAHPKVSTGFASVAYKGACAPGDTWWKTWTKF